MASIIQDHNYYEFAATYVVLLGLYHGFRDAIHLVIICIKCWCIMRYTVYPGLVSCPFYKIPINPL